MDSRNRCRPTATANRNCLASRSCLAATDPASHYHRKQQYSITALTNGGGSITERYAYTAYGTPTITDASGTALTASADNNRYTYTGREWDSELTLYHYRARMYDSVAGRFLGRDPIGYKDGTSCFQYCHSSPLIHTDPSGTAGVCVRGKIVHKLGRFEGVFVTDAVTTSIGSHPSIVEGEIGNITTISCVFSRLDIAEYDCMPCCFGSNKREKFHLGRRIGGFLDIPGIQQNWGARRVGFSVPIPFAPVRAPGVPLSTPFEFADQVGRSGAERMCKAAFKLSRINWTNAHFPSSLSCPIDQLQVQDFIRSPNFNGTQGGNCD